MYELANNGGGGKTNMANPLLLKYACELFVTGSICQHNLTLHHPIHMYLNFEFFQFKLMSNFNKKSSCVELDFFSKEVQVLNYVDISN